MMGNEVNKGRTMVGNEFEKVVVVNEQFSFNVIGWVGLSYWFFD